MSICIISDHIIMLYKTKFLYNPQHIDQVKTKSEGGGGGGGGVQPPSAPGMRARFSRKLCNLKLNLVAILTV